MGRKKAIETAVALFRMPTLARSLRARPLPKDVFLLIRIAAGCAAAEKEAMKSSGKPLQVLREASVFYLTQILLHPKADSYRMLGVSPDASQSELRGNMAWLLRWLHPDLDRANALKDYAERVTGAWENLKTVERRKLYDSRKRLAAAIPATPPVGRPRQRPSNGLVPRDNGTRSRKRYARTAFGAIVILAAGAAWWSLSAREIQATIGSFPW